jgi:hypothetical protein
MLYDVDEEGDGVAELQGRCPVTDVLPGSQGAVHCEVFLQVATVARSPARKAARMPCTAMRSSRRDRGDAFRES